MPCDGPAVLIVEDEPLLRMCALDALNDNGLSCYEAGDAEEALRKLEQHPSIALLFTDINMPGDIDGIALAERVHAQRPDIAIIVTSGGQILLDSDIPNDGIFLAKPYHAKRMAQLVKEKLDKRSGIRAAAS